MTLQLTEQEASTKTELYAQLIEQLRSLLETENDLIANAANCAALLYHSLPALNWVGFYFYKEGELVLGPFQGKPACVRITIGEGVCGIAALRRETIVVDDVEGFPGHIACDGDSKSELVVPLIKNGNLLGVLDLDSTETARFDAYDATWLETVAGIFSECSSPDESKISYGSHRY